MVILFSWVARWLSAWLSWLTLDEILQEDEEFGGIEGNNLMNQYYVDGVVTDYDYDSDSDWWVPVSCTKIFSCQLPSLQFLTMSQVRKWSALRSSNRKAPLLTNEYLDMNDVTSNIASKINICMNLRENTITQYFFLAHSQIYDGIHIHVSGDGRFNRPVSGFVNRQVRTFTGLIWPGVCTVVNYIIVINSQSYNLL